MHLKIVDFISFTFLCNLLMTHSWYTYHRHSNLYMSFTQCNFVKLVHIGISAYQRYISECFCFNISISALHIVSQSKAEFNITVDKIGLEPIESSLQKLIEGI